MRFIKTCLASAVTLAMVSTTVLAHEKKDSDAQAARMEGKIETSYALNRHLNPFDIDVEVVGDKAILSGKVEDAIDKDLAEQLALSVEGIKNVDNKLVIEEDWKPRDRRMTDRDFRMTVEDATITASVKSKLLWNDHTDGLDIDVDTKNGKVVLRGTADSDASKELAERLAKNTDGVRSVENRLAIEAGVTERTEERMATADDRARAAAQEGERDVSDAWISTKVKSSLLFTKDVDGTDIEVNTANGVVSLSGVVDSDAEKQRAVEVAQSIRGVKQVNAKGLKSGT